MKSVLLTALLLLYLLHNDFWFWNDSRLIAGIPIGLFYHLIYCVAASVFLILLVRRAWPEGMEVEEKKEKR